MSEVMASGGQQPVGDVRAAVEHDLESALGPGRDRHLHPRIWTIATLLGAEEVPAQSVPSDVAELHALGDANESDARHITPEMRAFMEAEGLLPHTPLHVRIPDRPSRDIADEPTGPMPAVDVKDTERVAADAAQPETSAQPASKNWMKDWLAEQKWLQEAVVATQGTRARFFLLIQASQPDLSRDQAWELATKQAYDELRQRCPDGSIVPSNHPWDREYMRQMDRVEAERETALAALEPIRESGDTAAYNEAVKATQQQHNGLTMFDRAVAATNGMLSTEPDAYNTIMHQFRLDVEEGVALSSDLVRQVCEADLIEDNAYRTILTLAEARGIEPSDVVTSPELEGERGSYRREIAAARLIAQGFARQVMNARAAAAKEEVPVPQSTYELARPITPAVNDRPVQPALIRHLGRAWSDMIAQRNQRQATFVYHRPGSLRNPWLHAGDAAEPEAVTAAYYSPAVSDPVRHTAEEDIFVQDEQDMLSTAEAGTAPHARINIPARMQAFRKHVAAVREARHRTDMSGLPSASTARAIADAKRQYATDNIDVQSALTTRWANLSAERSAWVKAAHQAHAAGDEVTTQALLANADRIAAQLEYEGLNTHGIDTQAARAAYFRANTRFTPDVLAAAGITLAAGDAS